ncbi:MAG: type II toxin-antitoxin system HicB family antitoxin [Saprospiraceae bacterium]|nr:type II toxin-antitoxin system HicB family antitoxin [Saprospiraceae bacterium]
MARLVSVTAKLFSCRCFRCSISAQRNGIFVYFCFSKFKPDMSNAITNLFKPLFIVEEDPEEGYTAKCPQYSIYTQGDTWEELIANIKEAILCHFDDGEVEIYALK